MIDGVGDLSGRRLERVIRRDHTIDEESGHEFTAEVGSETVVTFDGTVETVQHTVRKVLACRHLYEVGMPLVRCDSCTGKAGKPMYVCENCAIVCPVTGLVLCQRCSLLGPDHRRYSPDGLKQARKMGLFNTSSSSRSRDATAEPRCGWLARLLEWW